MLGWGANISVSARHVPSVHEGAARTITPDQLRIQELEARIERLEREKAILKNIPKGRAPARNAETLVGGTTLSAVEGSGRWLFGETSR
ncbi:hypothetical protein DID99_34765 [Burkholderia sp. Bp8986]|nr:hypothetical protein DID99_34765 [Burkholderia sp. Bp8986]